METETRTAARCEHGSRPSSCNDCYSVRMETAQEELLRCLSAILTRLDLEPTDAVFPCSAMREYIRTTITKARNA